MIDEFLKDWVRSSITLCTSINRHDFSNVVIISEVAFNLTHQILGKNESLDSYEDFLFFPPFLHYEMIDLLLEYFTNETFFSGEIVCEAPNNRLNQFEGKLSFGSSTLPLDNDKMLLRGCVLRNTRWCYGVVVFAGIIFYQLWVKFFWHLANYWAIIESFCGFDEKFYSRTINFICSVFNETSNSSLLSWKHPLIWKTLFHNVQMALFTQSLCWLKKFFAITFHCVTVIIE